MKQTAWIAPQTFLVTGGLGYIGSHLATELLIAGHQVILLDNLSNAQLETFMRIKTVAGHSPVFLKGDVRVARDLHSAFQQHRINAVIHLAGLKVISESLAQPSLYYENNLRGTQTLTEVMSLHNCHRLLFSSTAAVYNPEASLPLTESSPTTYCTHPYGHTKLLAENHVFELATSNPRWSVGVLRYFNPAGAHPSGLLGEHPKNESHCLFPNLLKVATQEQKHLTIYGHEFPTPDGTAIRDYIHITDLAKGHLQALYYLYQNPGHHLWNLGSNQGFSVLQVHQTFQKVTGLKLPYRFAPPRPGDQPSSLSDSTKAQQQLGWQAHYRLQDIVKHAWLTHNKNTQVA